MPKPKLVWLTPAATVRDCFSESDCARLAEAFDVREAREELGPENLAEQAAGADVWITGWKTPSITQEALDAAPGLKLVAHAAGSTRKLLGDVADGFWERDIKLTTANGPLAKGVGETILGLLIVSSKRVWQAVERTRRGEWGLDVAPEELNTEMYLTTAGVVSASKVGRRFMELARLFDIDMLLYDPYVDADAARELGAEKVQDLVELARRSDYLIIGTPKMPSTNNLISAEVLKALPDHCIVINAARGSVVDEAALIGELKKGRLFACLDVTEPEPPVKDSPLRSLPNVILTPHLAGHKGNARRRQGAAITEDVLKFLSGDQMHGKIIEEQWYIMA